AGGMRHNIPMTTTLEHPRVRPGLAAAPDGDRPGWYILWDQLRISHRPQPLSWLGLELLKRMNGQDTLRDLPLAAMQAAGGMLVPADAVLTLINRLDEALYLDSPRFDAYLAGPVREPACIGCYSGEPVELRRQLRDYFTMPGGPGLPGDAKPDGS